MQKTVDFDHVAISLKSHKILKDLIVENPEIVQIFRDAENAQQATQGMYHLAWDYLKDRPDARAFFVNERTGRDAYNKLNGKDIAAIRILDYVRNTGREFKDLNLRGVKVRSNPFGILWMAIKEGRGGGKGSFFLDMLHLFRQFNQKETVHFPSKEELQNWMDRYLSGMEPEIQKIRQVNKERILRILIKKIEQGVLKSKTFSFPEGISDQQKFELALKWWDMHLFHLKFAVRDPDFLNELLAYSLDKDTMDVLHKAHQTGIPFFVNPYYLSLLNVNAPSFAVGADLAIRYYVIYSRQLVEEFGHIVAWEKEDKVEPGKPNAAGWILPTHHNVHRRYPEVAILIPDTMGRACGGLCASCQRMYDFQRGNLNFDLEKLKPKEAWDAKLKRIMEYWENDSQLRDVLITGGDALMSADKTLEKILEEVYQMALRKKQANDLRADGEKYAEILRVRLGTRLPVYLPQRITPELTRILADFKAKASQIGIRQFVVQTHFQSPMEVTPEAVQGIQRLISAGWMVTNQLVFTAAASRRGHSAKLRKILNDAGVLTYYTFSVKGYMENSFKFATNARAVQEQMEEKVFGTIPDEFQETIKKFPETPEDITEQIGNLRKKLNLPFLATDRNVLNLPGVGKSMTFRTIGITRFGRRILEFDHDHSRSHSPIIGKLGKMTIIESKPIARYLKQLEDMGEDIKEYRSIWCFSLGVTEIRSPLFEYPPYDYKLTGQMSNIKV